MLYYGVTVVRIPVELKINATVMGSDQWWPHYEQTKDA